MTGPITISVSSLPSLPSPSFDQWQWHVLLHFSGSIRPTSMLPFKAALSVDNWKMLVLVWGILYWWYCTCVPCCTVGGLSRIQINSWLMPIPGVSSTHASTLTDLETNGERVKRRSSSHFTAHKSYEALNYSRSQTISVSVVQQIGRDSGKTSPIRGRFELFGRPDWQTLTSFWAANGLNSMVDRMNKWLYVLPTPSSLSDFFGRNERFSRTTSTTKNREVSMELLGRFPSCSNLGFGLFAFLAPLVKFLSLSMGQWFLFTVPGKGIPSSFSGLLWSSPPLTHLR